VIKDEDGKTHAAYRLTVVEDETKGQYYGVQGTTWREPPILDGRSVNRTVNGRRLRLFYDGGRVRRVAWRTPRAVYWVSNTLAGSLSARQMIALAASLRVFGRGK
jgi:polyisoprenyl-teichoic acid--peptidoglycan teichoic acid transferase